jgi:deoxycytidine triphosphate deaminase/cell division protein FtsB
MSVINKFSKEDKYEEKLLKIPTNTYLRALKKMPEKKYEIFKNHDPFPLIPDALLNSFDIIRYVYTTGMIYPFYLESLDGAVYTCNFSGKYKYWDEKNKLIEGDLDKDSNGLKLRPNSISFLGIEPTFRIPTYIVLRFNLKVQHVYKGLLLGTGPIVDPGFFGELFIPLHNLTSNEYIIKKGAPLICVEFTKLTKHYYRNLTKVHKQIINNLNFRNVPIIANPMKINRDLNFYLKKALNNPMFGMPGIDEISVGSSIPEAIFKAEESAKKAEKKVDRIKNVNFIALFGTLIAIATLVVGIISLLIDVNKRVLNISNDYFRLNQENIQIQQENKELKEKIDNLQSVINNMQQTDKDKKTVSE